MKSLSRYFGFSLIVGFTSPAAGQYEINSSVWMDAYSVQHHIDQYLSNTLLSYEYYQKWNPEIKQFQSALPARLSYPSFASKVIEVKATEMDYLQRNIVLDWQNFDPEKLDSLIGRSKKRYATLVTYDDQGRIIKSSYKNFEYKLARERIDYSLNYSKSDSLHGITAYITWSQGFLFRSKSRSLIDYYFNENQRLVQVNTSHQNKRENSSSQRNYTYDALGRLSQVTVDPSSKLYRNRTYDYTIRPFDLEALKDDYFVLKIPSIQNWLSTYQDSGLSIIAYQKFESNRNGFVQYSYLVDANQNRLLMLRPYPHYYHTFKEENSITKSYCSISTSQDLNDTLPYDPNYKPHYIGTTYGQSSIERHYTKPPGLVNAASTEGYKRSDHALPNGWRRLSYQRGSTAPSRFGPGYPASVRLDIQFDKHLILDPSGVLRYIIEYDKIVKIDEVKDL